MRSTRARGRAARVLVIGAVAIGVLIVIRQLPTPEKIDDFAAVPPVSVLPSSLPPTTTSPGAVEAERPNGNGAAWERTARAFATAYTTVSDGRDAWLARLKPLTDATLYAGLEFTDLTGVPVGAVGPGVIEVVEEGDDGGTIRFPLMESSVAAIEVTVARNATGAIVVTGVLPVTS